VWDPEQGESFEDASRVHASDAEAAAEQYVETGEQNACEYACLSGGEVWVHVVCGNTTAEELATAPIQLFCVTGESVPQYNATAKDLPEGRSMYRVTSRQQADDGWWSVTLEDLRGEAAGGFTFSGEDLTPPAHFSYVEVEGQLGVECVFRWRDHSHRKQSVTAEGFSHE
jgi:hypothetical protein